MYIYIKGEQENKEEEEKERAAYRCQYITVVLRGFSGVPKIGFSEMLEIHPIPQLLMVISLKL
jgi:hypothetical protein